MGRMIKIMAGSPDEEEHIRISVEVFGGYLKDDFDNFLSRLDDDHKEIFLRSAHFLKFYVNELYNLPKEQEHIKDIYGFIGLTSIIEFCSLSDPKFRKTSEEAAFKNYLRKGLTSEDLDKLTEDIEIHKEDSSLLKKKRIEYRLKLLYEFRSSFVHHITLPPIKRGSTMFLATFHQSGLINSLIPKKDRYEDQDGLYLTIRLSLTEYINLVKPCILRNLGYANLNTPMRH